MRRYTRDSVERALDLHFGRGRWTHNRSGYTLITAIGIVQMRTLKEAYLTVIGAAEGKRRALEAADRT